MVVAAAKQGRTTATTATTASIPTHTPTPTLITAAAFVIIGAAAAAVAAPLLAEKIHTRSQQVALFGRERLRRRTVGRASQQGDLLLQTLPGELLVRLLSPR